MRSTPSGETYFVGHNTKSTSWVDPRTGQKSRAQRHLKKPAGQEKKSTNQIDKPSGDLGPLPSGWEMWLTKTARVYFVDYNTKTTSWTDPRLNMDESQFGNREPLPSGWEMRRASNGQVYFVDHNTKTTSWADPRKTTKQASSEEGEAKGSSDEEWDTDDSDDVNDGEPSQEARDDDQEREKSDRLAALLGLGWTAELVNTWTSLVPEDADQDLIIGQIARQECQKRLDSIDAESQPLLHRSMSNWLQVQEHEDVGSVDLSKVNRLKNNAQLWAVLEKTANDLISRRLQILSDDSPGLVLEDVVLPESYAPILLHYFDMLVRERRDASSGDGNSDRKEADALHEWIVTYKPCQPPLDETLLVQLEAKFPSLLEQLKKDISAEIPFLIQDWRKHTAMAMARQSAAQMKAETEALRRETARIESETAALSLAISQMRLEAARQRSEEIERARERAQRQHEREMQARVLRQRRQRQQQLDMMALRSQQTQLALLNSALLSSTSSLLQLSALPSVCTSNMTFSSCTTSTCTASSCGNNTSTCATTSTCTSTSNCANSGCSGSGCASNNVSSWGTPIAIHQSAPASAIPEDSRRARVRTISLYNPSHSRHPGCQMGFSFAFTFN